MSMPAVTYGVPVVAGAAAAPFFGTPVVYSAPQVVYTTPGQVTQFGASSASAIPWVGAEAGHVTYLAPEAAETAQVMYSAGAEAGQGGQVTYLAPADAEAHQVTNTTGAEVGQAFYATAPTATDAGREIAIDASGVPVMEGGQITSLVPTVVEGSPVPTYVAPAEPVSFTEAGAGQYLYAAPMAARVNVSHEIFAKLAAGVQLTPEELRSLSGHPAPDEHLTAATVTQEQLVGSKESVAAIASASCTAVGTEVEAADLGVAVTSAEAKKKDPKTKSDSKKALKASKKKKEKGCC